MYNRDIINIKPLGFMWETRDPFLFCAHHNDAYPKANALLGPDAPLTGRNIGQDFSQENTWRMYHGDVVPGFPAHPHRGFETITIVLKGFVDHSDSHGAAGRYGNGDVQWMTAGSGLQHAEMFPLLDPYAPNPLKLFQVWLNLPAKDKFVPPFYKMLWSEDIPNIIEHDSHGNTIEVRLIAGKYGNVTAVPPAPNSWAAKVENEVAIWRIKLNPNAQWLLPPASQPVNRTLYFHHGNYLTLDGLIIKHDQSIDLLADRPLLIENSDLEAEMLLLQAIPIAEPIAQYGPFVMNTQAEIRQAISDFQRTRFGGWPWPRQDNIHPVNTGRFARYADGSEEIKN